MDIGGRISSLWRDVFCRHPTIRIDFFRVGGARAIIDESRVCHRTFLLVEFGGNSWCTGHSQRLEISFTPAGPDFFNASRAFRGLHCGCFVNTAIYAVEVIADARFLAFELKPKPALPRRHYTEAEVPAAFEHCLERFRFCIRISWGEM